VIAAGPDLEHAAAEVTELGTAYARATILAGTSATAAAVCGALDGATGAHLAAHGRFRADNPLFSSLRLHDGPLTVYDIEGLERVPAQIVLSACDIGTSAVRPGDELMGLATAFLGIGTAAVVAAVVPVSDTATRRLMAALHAELRGGAAPATALARARAATGAGAGFVCFGAG